MYSEYGERKVPTQLADDKPVEIRFDADETSSRQTSRRCVYWDFDVSDWSSDGCVTVVNASTTTCRCRHLTNFAVLVSLRHTSDVLFSDAFDDASDAQNLRLITLIGCSCSAVALFVSVVFFLGQSNPCDRVRINSHFCFNLFIAEILVLCGLSDELGKCFSGQDVVNFNRVPSPLGGCTGTG